jgi:GxGYxY sequence motif in domain of unknown function N-terminal/GxGYxYP putative glycoside hydrolase C-terminal domain
MWYMGRLKAAAVLAASMAAAGTMLVGAAGAAPALGRPVHGVPAAPATSLWPRFSTPQTVYVADAEHMSGADLLTATTLEGVYNAAQRSSRLFLIQSPQDPFWLSQLPPGITQIMITPPPGQSLLVTLLRQFRPFFTGAIVTNPSNPDTVNLASTMAGLKHAIVIGPGQKPEVNGVLGIPVIRGGNFDTSRFTGITPAATYAWGVYNLLPQSSKKLLVMLSPAVNGDVRDYAVAAGAFIFYLTSTDPDEKPVMKTIIGHTPVNTPIMGYVPNENADVADISSLGHFLNASDFLDNASFWAATPAPSALRESTQAAPIAAKPGTAYVAFVASDGDNAQYMQHRMADLWTGPDLGAVPAGWTVSPGAVYFDPVMLEYYNSHLPGDSELDAGPSGIGYVSQMNPADLGQFARLSGEIMAQDGLHTLDAYTPTADEAQYAKAATPALTAISQSAPKLEQQLGSTILVGQTSWYIHAPEDLFCIAHQQSEERPGKPVFLDPLFNAFSMTPADMLHIAQQLALAGKAEGLNFVFTTPSELALTMQRYYTGKDAGLPAANAQSMSGDQILAEPSAGPAYPFGPVKVTGPNLVTNPSGASGTAGWATSGGSVTASRYQGHPALHYTSRVTGSDSHVDYTPHVTRGNTYTFSVNVAGSGEVYLDVYNGTEDQPTIPVHLTSSYRHLTWTVTLPAVATGTPQLRVQESGGAPVSAYISGASIAASTAAC